MMSLDKKRSISVRFVGVLLAFALLLEAAQAWEVIAGLHRHKTSVFAQIALLALDGGLIVLWAGFPRLWERLITQFIRFIRRWGVLRWGILALGLLCFPYAVLYNTYAGKFAFLSVRWVLYFNIALMAGIFLSSRQYTRLTFSDVLAGALLTGAVFAFASAYTKVSNYPFSLSWSEGNSLWDYSLLFARQRYLFPPDKPIFSYIDPGRQFLWGVIYLIPKINIFWARFWNAFLFTVPPLILAWIAFRQPAHTRKLAFWATLWGFLFLFQGPIYAPLILAALLLLWAEEDTPIWLGVLLALVGGYLATVTRFTWALALPLWAWMLSLITPTAIQKSQRAHYVPPLLLSLASLLGGWLSGNLKIFFAGVWRFVSQYLNFVPSLPFSTNVDELVLHHPLLWSRLWPNSTFPLGILPGIFLATFPLLLLWYLWHRRGLYSWSLWGYKIAMGELAFFLAVGILVSLKIGGGNNLHNMDMFLISMLFITAALWQQGGADWLAVRRWNMKERIVLILIVLTPMYFIFLSANPRNIPDAQWWQPALQSVQHYVQIANEQGKEVLFMDQRQLLTFGYVEPTPLVVEYEKKYVMDKAMASDNQYFARYYHDLATHRFAVIITEPLDANRQSSADSNFAAENNAWVHWVSIPTLCYYRVESIFPAAGVAVLVPRDKDSTHCEQILPTQPMP